MNDAKLPMLKPSAPPFPRDPLISDTTGVPARDWHDRLADTVLVIIVLASFVALALAVFA